MLVSGFMTPAAQVVTANPNDPIEVAVDAMLSHRISAVVIVEAAADDSSKNPVGLVTKSELVAAYRERVPLSQSLGSIMVKDPPRVLDTLDRDDAAKALERGQIHHAVVINSDGAFVGIVSAWDIASECAKDSRAWPWSRSPDGKIHQPTTAH